MKLSGDNVTTLSPFFIVISWNANIMRKKQRGKVNSMNSQNIEERENVINIEHLNKVFTVDKKPVQVLKDISLQVKEGEFVTIVGHSGCGKSTLLKIINGLVPYEDGVVERNGHKVTGPGVNCGFVFQEHRLLPWLKIKSNVGYSLHKLPKAEREKIVNEHLEMVGLKEFADSYPRQLSGGMSQRAAIARGLVNNPKILLLDEPFGALDALTRIQMQQEIVKIQQAQKTTMLLVTHDIDEAIVLGDKVVVMSARPGEIKDIIEIKDDGHKRNSPGFNEYKKKIFNYLFEGSEEEYEIEYLI